MPDPYHPSPSMPDVAEPPSHAQTPRALTTQRLSRRAALSLAGGLAGVLSLGWLADVLAGVPFGSQVTGVTRQIGLDHVRLEVAPTPAIHGAPATITLVLTDLTGAVVAGAHVTLMLTMLTMDMGTITLVGQPASAGRYTAATVFPMSGPWRITVVVARDNLPPASADFDVDVR